MSFSSEGEESGKMSVLDVEFSQENGKFVSANCLAQNYF